MSALLDRAAAIADDLIAIRRDIHRHPELAFHEKRTASTIAERLNALGYRVRTGVGRTGIVAEIGTGERIVALRADMDALPIHETSDAEYRSTVDGVMHACGHDAHIAMLLGAAKLLADVYDSQGLGGTVRLIFQPAEEASDDENKSGAVRMIEDGAMDGVAAIFGIHIAAHLPLGKAYVASGPYMAGNDVFIATIHGKSAHAARPHEGIDAILLASHAVIACQNAVARRLSPFQNGVLSIGRIYGGTAENIIADRVTVHGTMRYFDDDVRNTLHLEMQRAFDVVTALGGKVDVDLRPGYPPVVNDARATDIAMRAVTDTLGADALAPYDPMMGAEDFAFLSRKAPGCFFWFGAALNPAREHHTPNFDIDERALPHGAAVLAACALQSLADDARTR